MVLSYTNLEGVAINFKNRSETVKTFGSWISLKDDVTSSDVVSWCDTRITKYENWIKECKNFKKEHQAKLIEGVAPETRLAGLSKQQLQEALAKLVAAEEEKAE